MSQRKLNENLLILRLRPSTNKHACCHVLEWEYLHFMTWELFTSSLIKRKQFFLWWKYRNSTHPEATHRGRGFSIEANSPLFPLFFYVDLFCATRGRWHYVLLDSAVTYSHSFIVVIMNNTTEALCSNDYRHDPALRLSSFAWHCFGLLAVAFGVPGHVLQIILLFKKNNQKDAASLYFIAISICELVFLAGLFWLWCVNMSFTQVDPRHILSCGVFYSVVNGSTALSNIYLASMSMDRSIMILSPMSYRLRVTRSHVISRVIIIAILMIIFLTPHHFYFSYDQSSTVFYCEFSSHVDQRHIHLWAFIHAIVFVSIPSLIVCLSSFLLLYNRCQHKRLSQTTQSLSARRMEQRSILIVFISLAMFFTIVPGCMLQIVVVQNRLSSHDAHCSLRWKHYKILMNVFLTLSSINYASKFYIHLAISTTFRQSFLQLIGRRPVQTKKLSPLLQGTVLNTKKNLDHYNMVSNSRHDGEDNKAHQEPFGNTTDLW